MGPVHVPRHIVRYQGGQFTATVDEVVTESPLTIRVNGEEFATLVCTPDHLEELVIGFLASEGVLRDPADLTALAIEERSGMAEVEIARVDALLLNLHAKRYVTSCCGKGRQSFVFYTDKRVVQPVQSRDLHLTADACFRLMEGLSESAYVFRQTGGVHNAALCDPNGLLLTRMDIGRHNALDKIYGHCLQHGLSRAGTCLAFSGRLSSEVLLKVAKIGCEAVLTKSAPTELALQLADELGITVVGFIRSDTLNVYTHATRIEGSDLDGQDPAYGADSHQQTT